MLFLILSINHFMEKYASFKLGGHVDSSKLTNQNKTK